MASSTAPDKDCDSGSELIECITTVANTSVYKCKNKHLVENVCSQEDERISHDRGNKPFYILNFLNTHEAYD